MDEDLPEPETESPQDQSLNSLLSSIGESHLEDVIYWAFQMLDYVKDKDDITDEIRASVDTPGSVTMLEYALDYRKDFMSNLLPKALARKGKDRLLHDDNRKALDIIDKAYHRLAQNYPPERQCPWCGSRRKRLAVLPPRPKKARA